MRDILEHIILGGIAVYAILSSVYIHKLKKITFISKKEATDQYTKQHSLKYQVEMQKYRIKEVEEYNEQLRNKIDNLEAAYEECINELTRKDSTNVYSHKEKLIKKQRKVEELLDESKKVKQQEYMTMKEKSKSTKVDVFQKEYSLNQKDLEDYISRPKTECENKRDYILYISSLFRNRRYQIRYNNYKNVEVNYDKDFVALKDKEVLLIHCQYCKDSKQHLVDEIKRLGKEIEKYCKENNLNKNQVKGMFYTNIQFTEIATKLAKSLEIVLIPDQPLEEFPRIKCSMGKDEQGEVVKVYHLPIDQQYDVVRIEKWGECFATTIAEAESKGFRRAKKLITY